MRQPHRSFLERSHSILLERIALPLADLHFRQGLMPRLRFLEKAQWWPRERILEMRDQGIRALVATVEREVPVYAKLWAEHGVRASQVRTAADLAAFPVVTKETFRPFDELAMTRQTGYRRFRSYSSGSTGKNFFVIEDPPTSGIGRASLLLAMRWAGWNFGEHHLQTGMSAVRSLDRRLKDWFLSCYYVSSCDLKDSTLDRHLEVMEQNDIRHIMGYPGTLFYLARQAERRGWNIPLISILTWGDNLLPEERVIIEKVFNTVVNDTYGCSEGLHVCAQNGGKDYLIFSTDVLVEFINEFGKPASSEERASLILTRIHPGPMPMVRYHVGDYGVQGANVASQCGRGFETMQSIIGRDTEYVETPTGNRLLNHFFTGCISKYGDIETFQVVQRTSESLTIKLKPNGTTRPETIAQLSATLHERGAQDMKIDFEIVHEIPLTAGGKRRLIVRDPAFAANNPITNSKDPYSHEIDGETI